MMSTFPDDAALAELRVTITDFQTSKYVYVSALMILVYEYTLTVGKERHYIWGRRPGLLEVLFYMNRYFPIVYQIVNVIGVLTYPAFVSASLNIFNSPEPPTASHYGLGTNWLQIFVTFELISQWAIASAIVTYRVWALYYTSRGVKIGVLCAWALAAIGMIVLAVLTVGPDDVIADFPGLTLKVCHGTKSLRLFFLPALPALLFDALAFVLGLWKLVHQAIFLRDTYAVNRKVYQVMTTDASIYFAVMLAVIVVHTIMQTSAARMSLRLLWDPMLMVLPSTACTRMVLNLREVGTVGTTHISGSAHITFSGTVGGGHHDSESGTIELDWLRKL